MPEDTQEKPEAQTDESQDAAQAEAPAAEEAPDAAAEDKHPIEVDVEDAGTLRKKVTVTVPQGRIESKFDEMFGELANTAQVPGFRIGRAPRRLIEKRFGKEVRQDVRNAVIGESLGDALQKADLKTLGEPEIDLEKIELPETGDLSFGFEVEIEPEFELPELKDISVTKQALEVTDQHVDEYVVQLRQMQARHEDSDAPADEGDQVLAGTKVTVDDLPPVERHGVTLRVAAGQVEGLPLVDLGKELAGKKAGDTAKLTMTVPDAHPNEEWRGKEATVEITVSQVRKRVLPEVNDEFAAGAGFDNLAEMREYLAGRMRTQLVSEIQRDLRSQICRYLIENTSFDAPEGVARRHTTTLLQRRYIELLQRGVPREQIDERLTELQAAAAQQAQTDLKLQFILNRIAEAEEVEVNDAEVNARVAQIAQAYNRRPERLRQELEQDGTLSQVESSLREEKVLDKLLEQADVTEAKPEEKAEPQDGPGEGENKSARKAAKKSTKKSAKKKAKKSSKKADESE
jgi:trigger factor